MLNTMMENENKKKMPVCFHFPSQVQYDEASDYTFYNEIVC